MQASEPSTQMPASAQRAEAIAAFTCLAALIGLYFVSLPASAFLQAWWAGLLLCALVPIALAFMVLYGSGVHREMGRGVRVLFLLWNSLLIFGGICLALAALAFVAVAIFPLNRFHY